MGESRFENQEGGFLVHTTVTSAVVAKDLSDRD
jgi:hypothetical protein